MFEAGFTIASALRGQHRLAGSLFAQDRVVVADAGARLDAVEDRRQGGPQRLLEDGPEVSGQQSQEVGRILSGVVVEDAPFAGVVDRLGGRQVALHPG